MSHEPMTDTGEHTPLPDDGSRDLWRWGDICSAAYNRARQTNVKAADALRPAMRAIINAGLLADDRSIAVNERPALLSRIRELEEGLREAHALAKLAHTLTGCRADDDYVSGVISKIDALLKDRSE